jgi:hypothetical protein
MLSRARADYGTVFFMQQSTLYRSAMCSIILNSQNNKDLPRRATVSEHILYSAELRGEDDA